jgi:alpha,alpha-trehalase
MNRGMVRARGRSIRPHRTGHKPIRFSVFWCALLLLVAAAAATPQNSSILTYIKETWTTLTRSNRNLAVAAVDPKFHPDSAGRWPVYLPASESQPEIEKQLRALLPPDDMAHIAIRQLPPPPGEEGLLYLPRPYVVPGGRFNEMYGWDSYFIQVGLLRDGLVPLAKDLADNFLYEIRNYGKILNANRTYYMGRSQPPFLTEMLLGVYNTTKDKQWLADAVHQVETYYRYWTTGDHMTPTGLSRYWDSGEGPAPEVVASERDTEGRTHYDLVREYYRKHQISDYDVSEYYDRSRDTLTPLFYKGDRSMRESGFDPSNRFGPFNIDIIHYNPVCLNSLLYMMEIQAAEISSILEQEQQASEWNARAKNRATLINRLLWDEKAGLYLDYDFVHLRRRNYPFLTTFYPLWAGIASREQAARIEGKIRVFERRGGLETSTNRSGNQWDAPFGWAPLEMFAVDGLRRYHYSADADRITKEFLGLINQQYKQTSAIVEKYDVNAATSNTSGKLQFGYHSNEAGFGWTNAVFTHLFDEAPEPVRKALLTN